MQVKMNEKCVQKKIEKNIRGKGCTSVNVPSWQPEG